MRNLFRLLAAFGAATTILIVANGAGAAVFAAPKSGPAINKLLFRTESPVMVSPGQTVELAKINTSHCQALRLAAKIPSNAQTEVQAALVSLENDEPFMPLMWFTLKNGNEYMKSYMYTVPEPDRSSPHAARLREPRRATSG